MKIDWSFVYRKKSSEIVEDNKDETKLARVLTVVDLTALGF